MEDSAKGGKIVRLACTQAWKLPVDTNKRLNTQTEHKLINALKNFHHGESKVYGRVLECSRWLTKRRKDGWVVERRENVRKSLARVGWGCEWESLTWMELVANMSTRNGSWSVNVKASKLNRPLIVNAIVIVSLTATLPSHNYKTGFSNDSVHQSLWLNFTWDAFVNCIGFRQAASWLLARWPSQSLYRYIVPSIPIYK